MAADINLIMAGSLHAGCNIYKGNDLAQIVRSATFLKRWTLIFLHHPLPAPPSLSLSLTHTHTFLELLDAHVKEDAAEGKQWDGHFWKMQAVTGVE